MKNYKILVAFLPVLFLLIFFNCKKEELKTAPVVSITTPSGITANSASSGGNVTADGGASVTSRGVCWSTGQNPTTSDSKTSDGSGVGSFSSSITGLNPGVLYTLKAYAINSVGTAYSSSASFSTISIGATLTTVAATSIISNSASSGGNISIDGGSSVTARGVCWATTAGPTISGSKTSDGTGIGNYTSSITGLSAGTIYYVRAYATNGAGTSYGNEISFTSSVVPPALTTQVISAVTTNSANCGGNITSAGGGTITARGVCWSTSTGPTINNTKTSDGTGAGSFVSSLTGLTFATTYYVRAYATNSAGTAYGNEITFTTGNLQITSKEESVTKAPGEAPDFGLKKFYIITGSFSVLENAQRLKADLIAENFNAGIFINSNGMYRVSCYSSDDESATRTKCAEIILLFPKYSDLWLLIKKESNSTIDMDGNTYSTVTIGPQVWMKENLKTTKFNDGTSIPLVTGNTAWSNLLTPGYCWYNNDIATYKNTYGALYNHFTIETEKLCPTGWRVATNDDWSTLTTFLGGNSAALNKLKEIGTTHWLANDGATNSSGFTAVPGGFRNGWDGLFYRMGTETNWWGSTFITVNWVGAVDQWSATWGSSLKLVSYVGINASNGRYQYWPGLTFHTYEASDGRYVSGTSYDSSQEGYSVRCIKN